MTQDEHTEYEEEYKSMNELKDNSLDEVKNKSIDEVKNNTIDDKNISPACLADFYRRDGSLEKCIGLLKEVYKKKHKYLDQVCLSYILFGKFEEAEKEIAAAEIDTRTTCKLALTLELKRNVVEMEFKEKEILKYLAFSEKLFKSLGPRKYKYILVDFRFFKQTIKDAFLRTKNANKTFRIYNYKCGTDEYQHILSTIIEYLLRYFDVDLIFAYYFILNVSCFLNGCKSDCIRVGHETIKREMLDPSFIEDLGHDDRKILYEIYQIKVESPSRDIPNKPVRKKRGRKKKGGLVLETVYHYNIKKKNGLVEEWAERNPHLGSRKNNKFLNASGLRMNSRLLDDFLGEMDFEKYDELGDEKEKVVEVITKEEDPFYDIP